MGIKQIQVTGINKDAVAAMQELITQLQSVSLRSNPFSDPKYQVNINVDRVSEGSAFLRYMLLSIVGRPTVTVSFSLVENNTPIAEETFTSSVFFQDSRDVGFRGGALGGSNLSFIRTNCRKLVKRIVQAVVASIDMTKDDSKQLLAANNGKSSGVATLKWVGVTAGIMALLGCLISLSAVPAKERLPAVLYSLIIGALFGSLIGFALARMAGLFLKLIRR